MSAQADAEAEVSRDLPAGAVDLTDCGRRVRGFMAAAFLPGALGGLAFSILGIAYLASSAFDPKALFFLAWAIPYMAMGALFGLIVTVPTILVAGLPAYFLYRRMAWTGWLSHSLGGAVIGWCAGLTSFGRWRIVDLSSIEGLVTGLEATRLELHLAFALLGVASALMLWSILHTRRAWQVFAGLIAACPPLALALSPSL